MKYTFSQSNDRMFSQNAYSWADEELKKKQAAELAAQPLPTKPGIMSRIVSGAKSINNKVTDFINPMKNIDEKQSILESLSKKNTWKAVGKATGANIDYISGQGVNLLNKASDYLSGSPIPPESPMSTQSQATQYQADYEKRMASANSLATTPGQKLMVKGASLVGQQLPFFLLPETGIAKGVSGLGGILLRTLARGGENTVLMAGLQAGEGASAEDIIKNAPVNFTAGALLSGGIEGGSYVLNNVGTNLAKKEIRNLTDSEANVIIKAIADQKIAKPKTEPVVTPSPIKTPNIEWQTGQKAWQQFDAKNNKSIIVLPKNTSQETVWHEVAHAVDRQNPTLRDTLAPEIKTITGKDAIDNEAFAGAFKLVAAKPELRTQAPKISAIMDSIKLPENVKPVTPVVNQTIIPKPVVKTGNPIIDASMTPKPIENIPTGTPIPFSNKNATEAIGQARVTPQTGVSPLSNEAKAIYHGTPEKFTKFDTNRMEGGAAWFTADKKEILSGQAGAVQGAGQKLNIMERYVKPNVKLATREMEDKYMTQQLIDQGYRGVKYPAENAKGYESAEWTKLWFPNEDTTTKAISGAKKVVTPKVETPPITPKNTPEGIVGGAGGSSKPQFGDASKYAKNDATVARDELLANKQIAAQTDTTASQTGMFDTNKLAAPGAQTDIFAASKVTQPKPELKLSDIKSMPEAFQLSRKLETLTPEGYEPFKVGEIGKNYDDNRILNNKIETVTFPTRFTGEVNGNPVTFEADTPYVVSGHNRLQILRDAEAAGKLKNPVGDYIKNIVAEPNQSTLDNIINSSISTNVKSKSVKDLNILDLYINGRISEQDIMQSMAYDQKKISQFKAIGDTFTNNDLKDFWNQSIGSKLSQYKNIDPAVMQERLNFISRIGQKLNDVLPSLNLEQQGVVKSTLANKIAEVIQPSRKSSLVGIEKSITKYLDTISTGGYSTAQLTNLFGETTTEAVVQKSSAVDAVQRSITKELESKFVPADVRVKLKRLSESLKSNGAMQKVANEQAGLTVSSSKTQQFIKDYLDLSDKAEVLAQKSAQYDSTFKSKVEQVAKDNNLVYSHGNSKGIDRIIEKTLTENKGDISKIRDLNRSTFTISDFKDVEPFISDINKNIGKVTRVKNNVNDPVGEFKQIIVNVETPHGNAEIKLVTPEMQRAAKEGGGHKLYNQVRSKVLGWEKLDEEMQKLYSDAELASNKRLASSSVISEPSTLALPKENGAPVKTTVPNTSSDLGSKSTLTTVSLTSKNLGNLSVISDPFNHSIAESGTKVNPTLKSLMEPTPTLTERVTQPKANPIIESSNTSKITADDERKLGDMGYSYEQVQKMKPQEITDILKPKKVRPVEGFTTSKYYKGDKESRYGRKINTQEINTLDDIQQLNKDIGKEYTKYFQDVKGGVKPNEVTLKQASDLGWTPEKIAQIPEGALLNDAQTAATAQVKADLVMQLAEETRKFKVNGSEETKGKMKDLLAKVISVDAVIKRSETELGRATQIKNAVPIPREFDDEALFDTLKNAGIGEVKDIKGALRAGDKLQEATAKDVFWSIYYNGILSGTSTHAKNFLDTGFNTLIEQGIVDPVIHPANIINQIKTIPLAIRRGIQEASDVWTGRQIVQSKYSVGDKNFKNKFLKVINSVGKALSTEDAFFRGINKEHSLTSLAYEQARKEGLGQIASAIKAKTLKENPTPEMLEQAVKESLRNTYNQKPEGWVGAVAMGWGSISNKVPPLKFLQPFSKIVGNVLNAGIDWTPFGIKRAIQYKKAGGEFANREMFQQIARATLGTVGMGYALVAATQGKITGSGPSNVAQRKQLEDQGWQANSIKIGEKYFSYQNLGAWGIPLAIVANYADAKKYNKLDEQDVDKRVAYAIFGTMRTITDKSFLSNVSQLFDAMKNNDPKYMQRFTAGIITSPWPNLIKQIGNYFNDTKKDPQNFYDYLANSMGYPFNKQTAAKLTIFGEPQKENRSILGRIIGQSVVSEKSDQMSTLQKKMSQNDVQLTIPTKTTKIQPLEAEESRIMTDKELRQYQEIYGKNLKTALSESNNYLMGLSSDDLESEITAIVNDVRDNSKYEFIDKYNIKK